MSEQAKPVKKTTATKYTQAPRIARRLSKDEYAKAHQAKAEGRPVAYVMVGVNGVILKALDITPVYTENFSGVCSAMKAEGPFIDKAESDGFSNLVCSYARIGLGICGCRNEGMPVEALPAGGIPDPDLLLGTGYCCDTRFKWYDSVSYYLPDVPAFNYEIPLIQSPYIDTDNLRLKQAYIDYEVEQQHRFVEFLENATHQKMDWDYYRQCQKYQYEAQCYWYEANRLRAQGKCVMPASDNFSCINPYLFNQGDVTTRDFYRDMCEEIKTKIANKEYVLEDEKYRICWGMGIPPWHQMNLFDYIVSKGGVVVGETTYNPSEPYDLIKVDTDDPIREEVTRRWEKDWEKFRKAREKNMNLTMMSIADLLEENRSDGIMCHATKSCRAVTVGQIHQMNVINEQFNLPTLFMESDMADSREFSEAQIFSQIDAFIETIDARKRSGK
ncbi:2-hydroxyacyl-CoA dehydratase family protein [Diplocloster hominis]|uniref:2-hydroxyacyl-CoA dehydratase subunit D n=1 Tax=Diplocloster hominis TaxID=3079010 RepID=UPI0031B9D0CA